MFLRTLRALKQDNNLEAVKLNPHKIANWRELIEKPDRLKIERRALRYLELLGNKSGMAHLNSDAKAKLAPLRGGLPVSRIETEHEADERKSDDKALHKMIRAVQKTIESKTMIREYTSNDTDALIAIWEKTNVLAHLFLAPEFVAFVKDAMRNMYLPNAQTWVYANGLGWCGEVDNHTDFVCIKQRIPSQPFSRP